MSAVDQTPETRSSDEWAIAGLFARCAALFLDALVVALAVTVLTMAVIAVSGGKYRLDSAFISSSSCTEYPASAVSSFDLPKDFRIDKVEVCTKSFLGIVFDRKLEISQIEKAGSHTNIKAYTARLNSDFKVIDTTPLDSVVDFGILIGLFAWLFFFEWRSGATFGKRIVGSRVWSLDRSDMTLGQSAIRTLVRIVPFAAFYLIATAVTRTGGSTDLATFGVVTWLAIIWSPFIAYGLHILIATRRGRLPIHDRLAGTILIRRISPPAPAAGPTDSGPDEHPGTGGHPTIGHV